MKPKSVSVSDGYIAIQRQLDTPLDPRHEKPIKAILEEVFGHGEWEGTPDEHNAQLSDAEIAAFRSQARGGKGVARAAKSAAVPVVAVPDVTGAEEPALRTEQLDKAQTAGAAKTKRKRTAKAKA